MRVRLQASGLAHSEVAAFCAVLGQVLGGVEVQPSASALAAPAEGWANTSVDAALDAVAAERNRQQLPLGMPLIVLTDSLLAGGSALQWDQSRAVGLVGDASLLMGPYPTRLQLWLYSIMKAICMLAPVPACVPGNGCIRRPERSADGIAAELADPAVCPQCALQAGFAGIDTEQGLRWIRGYGALNSAQKLAQMGAEDLRRVADIILAPGAGGGAEAEAPMAARGEDRLPVVSHYAAVLGGRYGNGLFSGYTVVMLLHLLRDLVPFLAAFEGLGLDPRHAHLICKPYPYADKDATRAVLSGKGYNVRVCEMYPIDQQVRRVVEEAWQRDPERRLLVVEDGGFVAGTLHTEPFVAELDKRCVGVVEQTRKGLYRWEQPGAQAPLVPLLNVAQSDIKQEFEPHLVARATAKNIQQFLPDYHFDGKQAIIVGYGAIGRQIAHEVAHFLRMKVWVVDPLAARRLGAYSHVGIAGVAPRTTDLLSVVRPKLVLGTTGKPSIDLEVIDRLPNGVHVGSTSSDQVEIDVDAIRDVLPMQRRLPFGTEFSLADQSRKLFLLANGYPINFYSANSIANESIDPIMSLLLLGAAQLAAEPGKLAPGIRTKEMNALVSQYGVERRFMYLQEL